MSASPSPPPLAASSDAANVAETVEVEATTEQLRELAVTQRHRSNSASSSSSNFTDEELPPGWMPYLYLAQCMAEKLYFRRSNERRPQPRKSQDKAAKPATEKDDDIDSPETPESSNCKPPEESSQGESQDC